MTLSNVVSFSFYTGVNAVGFVAKDITFENTAGPEAGQAVAFRSSADKTAMYRCAFIGYQDTLLAASSRQFYKDCDIYGTVDFIFGDAAMVLQNCNIYIRQNYGHHTPVITAQGRNAASTNSAISIQNCTVVVEPTASGLSAVAYLGRPWMKYSGLGW
ncbi:hypothetical protein RND81_10G163200 [Saponaria officinalis]|uniref:Pectinesterase n=1 Tax=Saponaria officinalis TaxID=3572 RepID=A0AAW1I3F9_SAPOF